MIYIVECAFTDPAREDAWHAWYDNEKLPALLSLSGFRASQRFRAIMDTPAPWLAVHAVRDAAVLDQAAYRAVGGGTFCGWDELVTNWRRNLFTGMEVAPEVPREDCLVLLDDPTRATAVPRAAFAWLDIAGLDRTVIRRGFATVDRTTGTRLARERGDAFRVFAPITARLVSPHGIDS